jgi:SAM-dependent methyltransferase
MNDLHGIESFSGKVADYVSGRPTYSEAALDHVTKELGLKPEMVAADIGAGTGLLTRSLRARFRSVIALEPNAEMRAAIKGFTIDGTAEKTGLPAASVDVIFAAQAFHWFNPPVAHSEFFRILRPPRPVVLLWNDRYSPKDSGSEELDRLILTLRSQAPSDMVASEKSMRSFFATERLNRADFENPMSLTREMLRSTVLSRSYAPRRGETGYEQLVASLDMIFDSYSVNDRFLLPYVTRVYWGTLFAQS